MLELKKQIESLLFISGKPLAPKKIAELIGDKVNVKDINKAIDELIKDYDERAGGIKIIKSASQIQMATSGENTEVIRNFIKDETTGELTKPSIETLTIIAYRGPIAKYELERIRGINCSLILRNLILRGLAEEKKDNKKREIYYSVTLDFLKYLGVSRVEDLPDYDRLSKNKDIDKFLAGEI
ncbi:MAG: SMC-Scp complex subunit ScpB [Patescibacteria group bacterium]|jgi:segregation and condensation protein B